MPVLPSNAEVAAALRIVAGEHILFQGSPELVAEIVLDVIRLAMGGDAPFNAVEDYRQFRRDNPDLVTVDK